MVPPGLPRGKRGATTELEVEITLGRRVHRNMSFAAWEDERTEHKEFTFKKRHVALRASLVDNYGLVPRQLHGVEGACFSFLPFLHNIIFDALEGGDLLPPVIGEPLIVCLKISMDGRKLRGRNNVGMFITLVDIISGVHRPWNQHTFALAHLKEKHLPQHNLWVDIGLSEGLSYIQDNYLRILQTVCLVSPILSGDWKFLSYVMGFKPANVVGDVKSCGWCDVEKAYLCGKWWSLDTFRDFALVRKPVREIPALSSLDCRYCPMHGINRILDESVRLIANWQCRIEVCKVMQEVCTDWGGEGILQCVEMKKFFKKDLHSELTQIFADKPVTLKVQQCDGVILEMPAFNVIKMMLDALEVYYHVCYTKTPSPDQFVALRTARSHLRAIWAAFEAPQTPTFHYMTTHLLQFGESDGSCYHTLQEGAEHHHQNDRESGRNVFTSRGADGKRLNSTQQLLLTQELRRILLFKGHEYLADS